MKISQLVLENFKAFEEIAVPFGSLTLLSGLNGSGKSSIVQALGLLRQSLDAGALRSGQMLLNGPLVEIGIGRDLLFQGFARAMVGIGLVAGENEHPQYLEWLSDVSLDADVLPCSDRADLLEQTRVNLFQPGFQFLRADRITPAPVFPRSQHAVGTERFLGSRGEFTAHFLLRFGEELHVPRERRHGSAPDAPGLLTQVNAWMQEFSPGVRVEAQDVPMTDFTRLAYSYRGEGAAYSDSMRPTNVGFGLTHALPVVTACLAAEAGTLLVIENPEAQLHPKGQAAIGRLLALTAAGDVQVVAESHSDHVMNGIRIATKDGEISPDETKLHFFRRRDDRSVELETPVLGLDGRLSFWPEYYFDQWERSLDTLLDR